jgi:hypothetical protein
MKSPGSQPGRDTLITGRTVVGLFQQRSQAEQAIRELKRAGFTDDQLGVAMHDQPSGSAPVENRDTEVAEGATVGALTGGVLGSLVGLLGSFLIPGVGPILVGGVLASLAGAGLGATTGGILGALKSAGVPEHDAAHFDAGLRAGGILVTVSAKDRTAAALAILQAYEADLGPSAGERRRGGNESYAGPERRLSGV